MVSISLFRAPKLTPEQKRKEEERLTIEIMLLNQKLQLGRQVGDIKVLLPRKERKAITKEILRRFESIEKLKGAQNPGQ
ncbi:MAG: hypothetical protein KGI06_02870 [Candidatus Micrarchaeota archaeon]|nr:hypothetical protein [Candidatus Micrarchaeota archaeon]